MSLVYRRYICRAHNAFSPGRALGTLLDLPPQRLSGTRSASTATANKPTQESRRGDSTETLGHTSSTTRSKRSKQFDRPSHPRRVQQVHNVKSLAKDERVPKETPKEERKRLWKEQQPERQGFGTGTQSGERWITEPNPHVVDYGQGQPWHVFSDCDNDERTRRLTVLLQWTRDEPVSDSRGNPGPDGHVNTPRNTATRQEEDPTEDTIPSHGKVLEYTGEVVKPRYGRDVSPAEIPWLLYAKGSEGNAFRELHSGQRLNQEIEAFVEEMKPKESERRARKLVEADIRAVVQRIPPHHQLEIFGSERTGLAIATSDLDFRLLPEPSGQTAGSDATKAPRLHTRKRLNRSLHHLHTVFARKSNFLLAHFRHARYPLISMQHKATGIDVQIVSSNDTTYQRAFMARYLQEFPALKEVYIMIRTMFDLRGLCDVFRGGVGSYGIFMMIVAALKMQRSRNGVIVGDNPSNVLQHFLQFWAEHDTYRYGVKIEPAELFEKLPAPAQPAGAVRKDSMEEEDSTSMSITGPRAISPRSRAQKPVVGAINPQEPYLLSLIDPADPNNDLGRKIFGIKHILATLRHFHQDLVSKLWNIDAARLDGREISSINGWNEIVGQYLNSDLSTAGNGETEHGGVKSESMLLSAVGASYHMYLHRRAKMQAAGKETVADPTPDPQDGFQK